LRCCAAIMPTSPTEPTHTTEPMTTQPEQPPIPQTPPEPQPDPRSVWRSRLTLLGIFAAVGVMAAIVFLSDPSGFEVRDPPNDNLRALATELDANFETWVAADGEIRFTLDTYAGERTPETTMQRIRDIAPELGLESLRDLSVVRLSGRLKISGTIDRDD
jgi:hypothetical protein